MNCHGHQVEYPPVNNASEADMETHIPLAMWLCPQDSRLSRDDAPNCIELSVN